jgi:transcriptional regulator with XRE-family HTH domain
MERVGHYLADVCREIREQAGARQSVIAAKLNASEYTVRRFERQEGKWSAQTDELIAAYAELAGVSAPDIWQAAIDRWRSASTQAQPAEAVRTPNGISPRKDSLDSMERELSANPRSAAKPAAGRRRRSG